MNRKGFGLIQFLGYIALFGVILCLGIHSAKGSLATSLLGATGVTKNDIYDATNDYVSENKITWINNREEEYTCLTVKKLIDEGYLKSRDVVKYRNDEIKVVREPSIRVVTSIELIDKCE